MSGAVTFFRDPGSLVYQWAWGEAPAAALSARGWATRCQHAPAAAVMASGWLSRELMLAVQKAATFPPDEVVVFTPNLPAVLIEHLLSRARTLMIVCDDIWVDPAPYARERGVAPEAFRAAFAVAQGWVARATAVACGSEPLLALVRQHARRSAFLVPWAAPAERDWPPLRAQTGAGLRIGWAGCPTGREADFALLRPALTRLVRERADLSVLFWGAWPSWAGELGSRVTVRPTELLDAPTYFARLADAALDVALAPVAPTALNASRSRAKFIDATVGAGAPLVASDFGPYRQLAEAGAPLVTVGDDPEAWYEALRALLDDAGRRETLVQAARAWVAKHATIDVVADDWLRAIEGARR